ncbi:MAG: diheme cytochrome c [Gammaproteobacteria bacterium]|nr:diheme cytochrome c [Gammaproteobacteria bacterium]
MKSKSTILAVTAALLISSTGTALAEGSWSDFLSLSRKKEVAPITDATYNEECGSCHFAYQPGLLPEQSWRKLMAADALSDHFGENAELPEDTRTKLLNLLVAGSAEKSAYKRSKKIMASLKDGDAPLRIIETPYIKRKHHDIPENLIKGPKVKSLSFCDKCHTEAAKGNFDDDTVDVPGHGRWTW